MLDWATRGRVILGLGTAHMPPDFELYGRPREHRGAILDELMDVMEACWSNAPFEYEGRFFQRRGHVTPAPYSRRARRSGSAPTARKGLRRAAERADAWVCDPQRDIDTVATLADEYRSYGGEQVVLFREALDRRGRRGGLGAARDEGPPPLLQRRRLRGVEPWVDEIRRARTSRSTAWPRTASSSAPRTRSAPPPPTGSSAPAPTTSRCACATRPARRTRRPGRDRALRPRIGQT